MNASIGNAYKAAIGGDGEQNSGDITAVGIFYTAAIGGGYKAQGGHITINGGRIAASTTAYGSGIGGGDGASAGTIEINGGEINAFAAGHIGGGVGGGIGAGCNGSGGTVSLSYARGSDYINTNSFKGATVTIDEDMTFTDADGNTYTGETSSEVLNALTDTKLYPAGSLPLTVSETQNGTVKAPERAFPGETVPLTVTPDNFYSIASVTLNGTKIVPENGVYSFIMPNGEANVRANFTACFTVSEDGQTYTIHNAEGWNFFRACMKDGAYNQFIGKTVQYTATGEFCAPFPYVANTAIFKNLTIAGTIRAC